MSLIRRIFLVFLLVLSGLTSKATVDSALVSTSGNTICYDACQGWAIVEVFASTSTGPFRIVWRGNNLPGLLTVDTVTQFDTIFNLCSGNYSVEVQDLSDASAISPINFNIAVAPQIISYFQLLRPSCPDSSNGSLTSLPDNGLAPYHFQWSTGPNDTNAQITELSAGTYGLTITDDRGCVYMDSINLTNYDTLKVNLFGSNVSCKNLCDGKLQVSPSGGFSSLDYSILWSNSDTNESISGLCPGNFVVTVTDGLGCVAKDSFIITEPDSLLSTFIISDPNCNESCDGEVTSLGTGGTRPYTYHWSGYSQSDSLLVNACAGLITTSLIDANGCYYVENIAVNEPSKIQIQPSITASTCGICDGDINVTVSGGSGMYHYLWLGQKAQDTISSIDSLCPGIYELVVTDASLCTDTFSIVLSDDTSGIKDILFTSSKSSCASVCDGALLASPLNGTGPYSYLWSPGSQTDSVLTGLCAGSYSIEITDAAGCKRIEFVELEAESNLSVSAQTEFNGCNGGSFGEIHLNVSNGKAPLTYSWTGSSATGSDVGGLLAGAYPFKVTDANGCAILDTVTVNEPDTIGISIAINNESCHNSCDASSNVLLSGGVKPYSVNWSNGGIGLTAYNLCEGSYWVEVTDAKGCVKRKSFNVTGPGPLQSNAIIYDADCGINNGAIKINPSGGTGPYSTSWLVFKDSLSRQSASQILPPTVVITDANGCSLIDTFIINNKNAPTFKVVSTDETCTGACDGQISISAPGINGPISYIWMPSLSNGTSINTRAGLCPGVYFVGIEAQGCRSVEKVKIKKANGISVSFDVASPSCDNVCDGSIIANVRGGLPPYSLSWSNGSPLKALSGLCEGTYTLNITDASGCVYSEDVDLEGPDAIDITLSTSNLTCYDVCDGKISASISGGKGPFSYLWSNGSTASSIGNLCAGNYSVTVIDANGCSQSENISLANGVPLSATFLTTPADCGQCNGSIVVTPTAGNGLPYSFLWSTGDTNGSISNVAAGIYQVQLTDNSGCSQDFTTAVGNVGGPSLSEIVYPISCYGNCDASVKATATGATPPYFYQWNDPMMQTGDSASGLCAGTYFYSATDNAGCMSFASVSIVEPEEIITNITSSAISCPGESDGSLEVSINGGQGPLSILWSNADTNGITDSLNQGVYSVQVTDSAGCVASDTFELNDPIPLALTFSVSNTNCFSSCDGFVKALVSGGSKPYSYVWNDPGNQTTSIAAGLCAGYIKVTINDAKGCQLTDSVLLISPSAISATPTLGNPTCADGENGSINLVPSGGVGPYRFSWSNGMNGQNISGLSAGSYTVTIVDSKQCTFQNTYLLNNPSPLNINVNITQPACLKGNGSASAIVTGGSGSYSFSWNTIPVKTTSSISNLWAGLYQVTVTDNNTGCVRSKEVIVDNAGGPALSFTVEDESCMSSCNGKVSVHTGLIASKYLWDDPFMQTDSTAIDLCVGTYSVVVTEKATGCISIDTISVGTSDFGIKVLNTKGVDCFGDCNGSATVEAIKGLPPIDYSWNTVPAQTNQTANNLCANTYTATATDSSGCSVKASVRIHEPESLELSVNIISNTVCAGSCGGKAVVNISGGTGPFAIYWNGTLGSKIASNLCAGTNSVEIIDLKGCSELLTFTIQNAMPIMANAIIALPSCGSYDGSISLNPSGGKGPYFYSWSTGASTSTIDDLFAGIYSVNVTDINGCSKVFNFFMNNPNAPLLNFDNNTVKCNGDCNGVARVSPIGGVAPYSYIWDYVPVSTLDSLEGLCSGVYFVKVTDATACISFGADTISEPPVLEGQLDKITDGCGGFCEGQAIMIAQGGTAPYSYMWNSTPPQSSATATNLCSGTVQVILTDVNDCQITDSVSIIPPAELLIDSVLITNATCFTNADGEAEVFHQGGTAPVRYLWSNGQMTKVNQNLRNGEYIIQLTDTNGCITSDTIIIGVQDTVFATAFVDSFICIGSSTMLKATGYGVNTFQWFADSSGTLKQIGTGDSVLYFVEDTVTILLKGLNNASPPCFDTDTSYIVGVPAPIITASSSNTTIDEGSSTELLASPYLFNGSYAWSPSESLNDSASIAPIATPEVNTIYVVIGTDEFGCSDSDSILISVVKDNSIINGFSPNGDGVNDKWEIPSLKDYPDVVVEVYNRWGVQVFRSIGYKEPWDGQFEGEVLPGASYYFVIDYFGNGEKIETGAVTILF